jgi:hypothetical protein
MSAPELISYDDLPEAAKSGVRMVREEGYGVRIVSHAWPTGGPSYEFYVDYDAPDGQITIEEGAPARHA